MLGTSYERYSVIRAYFLFPQSLPASSPKKQRRQPKLFDCRLLLDYQDSNLEKQDQNLLCYHYTIVQSFIRTTRSDFDDAKILLFS